MIQEIPYGRYEKTDDSNSELPVSIEVLPHKAIMIHEIYNVQNIHTIENIQMRQFGQIRQNRHNREISCQVKLLLIISFFVPFVIIISSFRI